MRTGCGSGLTDTGGDVQRRCGNRAIGSALVQLTEKLRTGLHCCIGGGSSIESQSYLINQLTTRLE